MDIQARDVDSPARDGIVLGQAPRAGAQADPGATVAITVGRFEPDPEPEPGDGGEDEGPGDGPGAGGDSGGGTGGAGPQG